MSKDYIPASDAEFDVWQDNFLSYALDHWGDWGMDPTDLDPVINGQTEWKPAYASHVSAQAAAQSARQAKDDVRSACEQALREQVRRVQAHPGVSDADRLAMSISVRDTTPTSVGLPVGRPVATVDASERLRHTIHFADEANPTRKARPDGVMGCELWLKVGEPPADPFELTFLAVDTRTPYVAEFNGADGGKAAHYMLRWVNTRGEKGPWSQTVTATIGA